MVTVISDALSSAVGFQKHVCIVDNVLEACDSDTDALCSLVILRIEMRNTKLTSAYECSSIPDQDMNGTLCTY